VASDPPPWLKVSGNGEGDSPAIPARTGVLFVCTGNICRSAFAAAALRYALGQDSPVDVSSAGIMALAGRPMDELMAAEAHRLGIADTSHCARQLTGRMLRDATLVVIFGPEHAEWITLNHPEHAGKVAGLTQLAAVLDAAPRRGALPLSELPGLARDRPRTQTREDWIPDPYRRGPRAARAAAVSIAPAVATLARRLQTVSDAS